MNLKSVFEDIQQDLFKLAHKLLSSDISVINKSSTRFDPVTTLDTEINQYLLSKLNFSDYNLLSEEIKPQNLNFPLVIIDPLDGTKELVHRSPECVTTFSVCQNEEINSPENSHFIYNFFLNNGISSFLLPNLQFIHKHPYLQQRVFSPQRPIKILISRSEWIKYCSFLSQIPYDIEWVPVGSIAYKLQLLAQGHGDLCISFNPKSIWDISAGTALLAQLGFQFYNQFQLMTSFDRIRYEGPLMWCPYKDHDLFLNLLMTCVNTYSK